MIPPLEQARRYLSKIDSAVSGQHGHDKTYHVACLCVNGFGLDGPDARIVMDEYSSRCSPPWTESEIEHKIRQAQSAPETKGRGYLLRNGVSYKYGQSEVRRPSTPIRRDEPVKSVAGKYVADAFSDLPSPIPDGTRELIKAAFAPGEGIKLAQGFTGQDGREIPKSSVTLSREEWLRKLDGHAGDVNKFMRTADRNGIFIAVNPLKIGGSKDADVTSYRHCLLEFDSISVEEQWSLIEQSRIPATAVILSGKKSVHAWVNVDAKDRKEFDERVKLIYDHFAEWKPDVSNKNPSRYSRLPGCERGKKRQELLALKVGADSFSEWQSGLQQDGIGQMATIKELLAFDTQNNENSLVGRHWLFRGGSCLIVGQSGLGKSSFAIQSAVTWALGRAFFGTCPVRPLKSLIIQAENDMGDLAEMVQGIIGPHGLNCTEEEIETINRNIVIIRDTIHTGFEFCQAVQRLIDIHKPDLVWFDPLLSFIGDDISKQAVCSQFLRSWLGPIAEATGVCWMMVHHTGKPATDPKSRSRWHSTDFSYSGIGSSEVTNWARAVINLDRYDETTFELKLSKRGKRAGATDIFGAPTMRVWLKHAEKGIRWEQAGEPEDYAKKAKSKPASGSQEEQSPTCPNPPGRPKKLTELMPFIEEFRSMLPDDHYWSMGEATSAFKKFAEKVGIPVKSDKTAQDCIEQLGREKVITCNTTTSGYDVGL